MKISELIAKLQAAQAEHGDVEACCWAETPESWSAQPVRYLTPEKDEPYGPVVAIIIEDEHGMPDDERDLIWQEIYKGWAARSA